MPVKIQINKTKVPIKIWNDNVESLTIDQATVIADTMPVVSHVALMPDCHLGVGMPIGGVVVLDNAICPNMVGADIGCGMMAVKTNITDVDIMTLRAIVQQVKRDVPVGFNKRSESVEWEGFDRTPDFDIIQQELDNSRVSLGTLGGGNHFKEIQKGSDGFIWFMIHSGSRNFGYKIAEHYQRIAVEKGIVSNGNRQLAYFDFNSDIGQEYFQAMNFAMEFAQENRNVMANFVKKAFTDVCEYATFDNAVNIHHNYAEDIGYGQILHRKGATKATKDTIGIIPGSQGSCSYIVKGLGNKESFESCSHGAGRLMSRTKAKKLLDRDSCEQQMKDMGLELHQTMGLDEATAAYKDIKYVMECQSDLVEILVELKPYKISAIKG
jgi:tRNA-splicing ligase RtcB